MGFSCDPKDPRSPPWVKRICRNLRWVPFFFIVGLIAYAYLTVVFSLALRYHLARKAEWVSALLELLFSTTLAGGAVWSFIVAVFKDPGSPLGRSGNQESWRTTSSRVARPASEYELGAEGGEEAQSLMRGLHEDPDDNEAVRAPLFNVPIPGQPQYPARSGRQQLADLRRLPSQTTSSIEARSNIWVKSSGESRWCNKCEAPKPDRAHHCSACQRCVLRMDHHCPWLANRCVGLRNHKAFFLFLFYTALFCVYCCQETGRALLRYVEYEDNGFETSPISWAVVLFLGFIFGASLVPFAGYHAYLICKNRTTIESMEGSGRIRLRVKKNPARPNVEDRLRGIVRRSMDAQDQQAIPRNRSSAPRATESRVWRSDEHLTREERRALKKASKLNVYNVGTMNNWRSIMGNVWYLWFIPIGEPLSDGFSFLVRTETLKQVEQITASIRVGDQQRSNESQSPLQDYDQEEAHNVDKSDEEVENDSVYGESLRRATRFGYPEVDKAKTRPYETGLDRKPGQRFQGAHGEMEWGEAPKKSFVLFGIDDDEEEA